MDLSEQIAIKIREILSNFTDLQISNMKNVLESKGKIATGYLISSFSKEILSDTKIKITYADYGRYVDGGRLPGGKMPPINSIKNWCQVKGIPESMAFPIAKSIAKKGIKPVNFTQVFYDGLESLVSELSQRVADEILTDIKITLENI